MAHPLEAWRVLELLVDADLGESGLYVWIRFLSLFA
jgi:hypothetical protein